MRRAGLTQTEREERNFALKVAWLCHRSEVARSHPLDQKSHDGVEWGQRSKSRFNRRSLSGFTSRAPQVMRTLGREARGAGWELRSSRSSARRHGQQGTERVQQEPHPLGTRKSVVLILSTTPSFFQRKMRLAWFFVSTFGSILFLFSLLISLGDVCAVLGS